MAIRSLGTARVVCVAAVHLTVCAGNARADAFTIFTDTSFWNGVDHTLIDFETEPDGTPIDLFEGQARLVDGDLYESLGLVYVGIGDSAIGNDSDAEYESVHAQVGSLENTLLFFERSSTHSVLEFTEPAYAFSMSVIVANQFFAGQWELTLFAGRDDPIGKVFLDDFITDENSRFRWGTLGVVSDRPIAFFGILAGDGNGLTYDDVRFRTSPIPAPGGVVLFAAASVAVSRRRR